MFPKVNPKEWETGVSQEEASPKFIESKDSRKVSSVYI